MTRPARGRSDAPTRIRNAYGRFATIPTVLVRDSALSDGAVRLYALLWDYSGATDREAWPTRTTMAADLGCSVDTIDRRVSELEKRGAISVTVDLSSDARRNVYTIVQLDQIAAVIPKRRKNAALSGTGKGRTDAAQIGRKSAVAYKEEPEPSNQRDTVQSSTDVTSEGVDNSGTGPKPPTPKVMSDTAGKPVSLVRVREAVSPLLDGVSEKAMGVVANRIIGKGGDVADPTAYVIAALRNPEDGLEWLSEILGRDWAQHLHAGGSDF